MISEKKMLGGNTIYWTYENCKAEAIKFKYRTDFNINSRGAASSARNNGWYDEICSHMVFNTPKKYWREQEINFLINNYDKSIKYCAKQLNKSYYSIKSMRMKLKTKNNIKN